MFTFKKIDVQKLPVQKLLIIALTIIALLSIRTCSLKNIALNDKGLEMNFYKNQTQAVTVEKNKLGEEVVSQKILLIQKDKDLQKELLANSNLNEITNHYKVKLSTLLTNVNAGWVTHRETGDGDGGSDESLTIANAKELLHDSTKVIPVGTKFMKDDKWFKIKGSIADNGINFDTISFLNEPTINVGWKRQPGFKGYFKKQEQTLEVINPNPYTSVIGLKNINFKERPKRFYETRLFSFGVGAVAATIVNSAVQSAIRR